MLWDVFVFSMTLWFLKQIRINGQIMDFFFFFFNVHFLDRDEMRYSWGEVRVPCGAFELCLRLTVDASFLLSWLLSGTLEKGNPWMFPVPSLVILFPLRSFSWVTLYPFIVQFQHLNQNIFLWSFLITIFCTSLLPESSLRYSKTGVRGSDIHACPIQYMYIYISSCSLFVSIPWFLLLLLCLSVVSGLVLCAAAAVCTRRPSRQSGENHRRHHGPEEDQPWHQPTVRRRVTRVTFVSHLFSFLLSLVFGWCG